MNKLKYLVLLAVLALIVCMGTSCKGKEKTFTSNGITVTLTSKFKSQNIQGAQVVYVTKQNGFMGNQESKTALSLSDNKLSKYTEMVISTSKLKDIEYQIYDQDGVKFGYAYYTASVDKLSYKYMLVTKEGKNHYYAMNFWAFEKSFSKYEDQFMEWAKLIVVE